MTLYIFSQKLLEIISVLEPGISKSRGITLLELTEAKSREILKKYSWINKSVYKNYDLFD